MTMPTKLSPKARAQERKSNEAKNWLGLWALSLGFCAIILAGTASFAAGDHVGAALILLGAATIMGLWAERRGPTRTTNLTGKLLRPRVKTGAGEGAKLAAF
jgi:uncharacterized membrane protein HdeD (DUF308 family)